MVTAAGFQLKGKRLVRDRLQEQRLETRDPLRCPPARRCRATPSPGRGVTPNPRLLQTGGLIPTAGERELQLQLHFNLHADASRYPFEMKNVERCGDISSPACWSGSRSASRCGCEAAGGHHGPVAAAGARDYQTEKLFGFHVPGLGIILTVAIVLVTGRSPRTSSAASSSKLGDAALARIPIVRSIYGGVKQISDTLFSPEGKAFRRAVLVRYPHQGAWTVALVTGTPEHEVAASSAASRSRCSSDHAQHHRGLLPHRAARRDRSSSR